MMRRVLAIPTILVHSNVSLPARSTLSMGQMRARRTHTHTHTNTHAGGRMHTETTYMHYYSQHAQTHTTQTPGATGYGYVMGGGGG
mmetsp:Transcript_3534/g.5574  ORF Transcript_3534/g.5574 Transcript_3534/m.5574 type:complete len:86 (-) Transcript_3534:1133-1390(-)